jgi:hypothetical protein
VGIGEGLRRCRGGHSHRVVLPASRSVAKPATKQTGRPAAVDGARKALLPDQWDANVYRQRAEAWRRRAAQLQDGDNQKSTCLALAEDYKKLANLIEQRAALERRSGDTQ